MKLTNVIKNIAFEKVKSLKGDKVLNKIFLINIFFVFTEIIFFIFSISNFRSEFSTNTITASAIIFLLFIIFLPYIFAIRYAKIVNIDKERVMKNFAEMLILELREPLSFAKLQSEILNEVLPNIRKSKAAVINSCDQNEYHFDYKDYDSFKKITEMSVKTSQYGLDLIENFMISFRKPELNYKMIKKEFFIKDIISKAIKVCSIPFPEIKNIEINIEDFCIRSNSNYIKHIIINLIKNAYIHNGRNVKLSIRSNGKILYITDYGLGINRSALRSIFDKFYSRHRGGVGIGLFFCKSAMEQMGGSIECESEEGQYTKFTLDFSKI